MDKIILIVAIISLGACTSISHNKFNKTLSDRNMSVVKETQIYGNWSTIEKAILLEVNGKKILHPTNSHNIREGKNTLLVDCQISGGKYENKYVKNNYLLHTNLIKGHTYEIFPFISIDSNYLNTSCIVTINDLTKI